MFRNIFKKRGESLPQDVIERELQENIEAIKSLRDYDKGEKEISTDKIRGYLSDI